MPDDFEVPARLVTPDFVLEPLGPQHNERDYAAWNSSMEHILATPGLVEADDEHPWPHPMTLGQNLDDLVGHAEDFAARRGFTYTVLDPSGTDVIGCLYIYPTRDEEHDVRVKSWVTAACAELDPTVWRAVSDWLAQPAVPEPTVRRPHLTPTTSGHSLGQGTDPSARECARIFNGGSNRGDTKRGGRKEGVPDNPTPPVTCIYPVAGTGFEPVTSGL